MDEGPRYPGSLVVQHAKQQALEFVDKYRRRRKRQTELPRVVSVLLAWEGAIVAGAFLAAIAHVAASAYMMERFDERTRRTSLVRYYQQRTDLAAEAVQDLQASIAYYSRHTAVVERQLEYSTAAARECQRRLTERRRQLEQELTAGLGLGSAGGGGSGGDGAFAAALAPWRSLYIKWRLDGWRQELERLDREARQLEQSLQHDQLLVDQARDKLHSLARELRREAAAYEALQARLSSWRRCNCRSMVFSGDGQLVLPGWSWGPLGAWWRSSDPAGDEVGSGRAANGANLDAGTLGSSGNAVLWSWTMQVYVPTWMDDDEWFDHPPPRGEAPGDRDEDDLEGEGGGNGDSGGDLLSELRPLLGNALPRW